MKDVNTHLNKRFTNLTRLETMDETSFMKILSCVKRALKFYLMDYIRLELWIVSLTERMTI